MKVFFAAAALLCTGLLTTHAAHAQTTAAASREEQAQKANEAGLRKRKAGSPDDLARMQRRMSMNPDEVKRDQQIEVLEARSGVTSYSAGSSAGSRQYEKGSGGFTVKRFRDKNSAALQKRGQSRPAPGIDPKGKPLKHKKPHKFLGLIG
ncbi:hypothetical protein F0P96_19630 [Hymenobacter busanensis]|uniref:Uncharacterized protein n=1 Tax=Hymenobacter busanensis TaxID=2607656 RepID=A0A7L4ZY72_9BACT|nr:hypothetical protein [Hymenobacter busanensis]KAA9325544.1 hypothetical protein F0P96_19630 [Hymenobacter busanensis]QHJ07785.1 hypothetical protein GUY19_11035 [Hymenobacter busanensis]